jgi:hypothetical protein
MVCKIVLQNVSNIFTLRAIYEIQFVALGDD